MQFRTDMSHETGTRLTQNRHRW